MCPKNVLVHRINETRKAEYPYSFCYIYPDDQTLFMNDVTIRGKKGIWRNLFFTHTHL